MKAIRKSKFNINFTFALLILCSLYERIQNIKLFQSFNEITIKLKGSGNQYILNNNNSLTIESEYYSFSEIADQILINGVLQNYNGNMVFNLEKEVNNITMKFNNLLTNCNAMFYNLSNILEIDLSKFDSSQVTGFAAMFYDCTSLSSINLNNLNTASVNNMHRMFNGCGQLLSLDFSGFQTSSVNNMYGLFFSCYSLLYLDVKSFDTSHVKFMTVMFYNCSSLKSLDLHNFDTTSVESFHGIFKFCSSLLYLDINNFHTPSANNMNHMFYGCKSLIYLNIYNFETTSVTRSISDVFKDFNINAILCINENAVPLIDNIRYVNENFINDCSNYCFTGENKKIIIEKNICISNCYNDDIYIYEYENICYQNCPNNTHISFDHHSCENGVFESSSTIVKTDIFTNVNTYTNDNTNDNIINLDWDIDKFFNGLYELDNINSTIKDKIIENIKNDIINGTLNFTNIIGGEKTDLIIKETDTLYQITTSDNQNNKEYEDISTIQLGQCEKILKRVYDIDEDMPLIIFKIDHYIPDVLIPVIGYDIFHPINKTRLNLEYCKDEIINFQIPVILDEDNLFKYDPNSEYYTDQCYSYTTDNGTDIILNDRQNEYNNNNYSLCENNCSFVEYNKDSKKASCDCSIKSKDYIISEIIDEKNILSTYDFNNQNSASNMVTMKCVYTVFTKEGLSKNIGNYILLIIIIIFAILSLLFYKFGYEVILSKIQSIKFNEEKKLYDNNNIKIYHKSKNNEKTRKSVKIVRKNTKRKSKKFSLINTKDTKNSNLRKSTSVIKLNKNKNYDNKNININKEKLLDKENMNFNDFELNTLSYEKALKYDKRTIFQYYISLIKTKHPLIFSFIPISDYNSLVIKISLFLILFSMIYILNALLFTESTIHKIYEDGGIYNLFYFIPKIFLSFFISHILYVLIKYFILSERNLLDIKTFFKDSNKITMIKRRRIFKYILYFIISLGFFIFLWYYLSSFCAVYKNSQTYLIKNTLISLVISLIYPFIINILPCIFRIMSLKSANKQILYKISKVIQLV